MKSRGTRVKSRYNWDRLKVSFWFAPVVMSVVAILLVWVMHWLDDNIPNAALESNRLLLTGTVSELRIYLLNMAGTVLATAGVVFTLLTLPLSTVVAQYGSRLLRVFLGDRTTQFVLGMFVGTFVYCVAAATSMPPVSVQPEGPQITTTFGLFLMMATFGSLILLVQHISTMLQAPNIASGAAAQLLDVVRAEMPDDVQAGVDGDQVSPNTLDPRKESEGFPLRAAEIGYIEYIDPHFLLTLAIDKNLSFHLLRKPGDFVGFGTVIALVWPAEQAEQWKEQILDAFQIGNKRTPTQDVEYAVNQLVEMAVRAMSPAINDPFTAMTCLDYIGVGLALFISKGERSAYYYDQAGQLRLNFEPVTFDELLSSAFDMIRHCSADNASVLLHMLAVIDLIGQQAKSPAARQKLLRHACLIQAESQSAALIEADRQSIQQKGENLQLKLQAIP